MPVQELDENLDKQDLTILDVRSDQEFLRWGPVARGSTHLPAPPGRKYVSAGPHQDRCHLTAAVAIGPLSPPACCKSMALLQWLTFPVSWGAWKSSDLPVEQPASVG